ncbi:MAG TPA: phosphoribosyltransferase [Patescibacteria group bacterium]|nr:phosphoribosyltransferase [Patescibacteria group bacterium]
MIFQDRTQAGRMLAHALRGYAGRQDAIVLGAPRGGVPVAFEVATQLKLPLDVFVLRKLGVPWQEELAFGAIAEGGIRVLEEEILDSVGLSPSQIEEVARQEQKELDRRLLIYRAGRPPLDVRGRTVILVDDGIATGSTARAAITALRQMQPARIVLAVPVAPPSTCLRLRSLADELVVLEEPDSFYAIGQFYLDFEPVSDQEVTGLLARAWAPASAVAEKG